MSSLKHDFLLDPTITFLNHGSFGACPKPVYEAWQRWQLLSEQQPVAYYQRHYDERMNHARAVLAEFVNAPTNTLIFVPNATVAMNAIAQRLNLQPGDEILTTDHEYGAMDYLWNWVAAKTGAIYKRVTIPHPIKSEADVVEAVWAGATLNTKVLFLSHITSPTALILPIKPLIDRARNHNILTIIDGAHAIGQIALDVQALDADIYTSNCHKWLCAPKGSAFLYVREALHPQFDPFILSWGYVPENAQNFAMQNQWQGTRDISAFLTIPDAIQYQRDHDWESIRAQCHMLAQAFRQRVNALTGFAPIAPDSPEWYGQMAACEIPLLSDWQETKRRLIDDFKVEIPITQQGGRMYIRASFQAYSTPDDLERALEAIEQVLK